MGFLNFAKDILKIEYFVTDPCFLPKKFANLKKEVLPKFVIITYNMKGRLRFPTLIF
jgi:hypothetical protein